MIRLQWSKKAGFDVDTYQVFRSMVGIHLPHVPPSALYGTTLVVSVDGRPAETVSFVGPDSVAQQVNRQLSRGIAYTAQNASDGTFLRSPSGAAPGSVEVLGGTSLPIFDLEVGLRTERSEWYLVGDIPGSGSGSEEVVSFSDPDGGELDYYSISTISSSGEESRRSPPIRPLTGTPGPVCVVSGTISDAQGIYVEDAKVVATPLALPIFTFGAGLSKKPVVALTDAYGKFSLPLLQGTSVIMEVEETGYSRTFTVPSKDSIDIADLESDFEHRYPLNTEV